MNIKNKTLRLTIIAMLVALFAVLSQIVLPLPFSPVPITLQTAAISIAIIIGGATNASYTVLIYLLLGAVGAPVFAGGGGGLGVILGPTGGFLLGFLPAAFIGGLIWQKFGKNRIAIAYLCTTLADIIILIIGFIWFAIITGNTLSQAFILTCLPFLPGDAL
ncbi:MAG: biotin transporter BioY, partial [Clostridiales bacterium]